MEERPSSVLNITMPLNEPIPIDYINNSLMSIPNERTLKKIQGNVGKRKSYSRMRKSTEMMSVQEFIKQKIVKYK